MFGPPTPPQRRGGTTALGGHVDTPVDLRGPGAFPATHDASRAPSGADVDPPGHGAAYQAAMAVEALVLTLGAFKPANRRAAEALIARLHDGLREGFSAPAAAAAAKIAALVAKKGRVSGPDVAPAMLDFLADTRDARLRIAASTEWPARSNPSPQRPRHPLQRLVAAVEFEARNPKDVRALEFSATRWRPPS